MKRIIFFLVPLFLISCSCQRKPKLLKYEIGDKEYTEPIVCYQAKECLYRIQKSKDKSACFKLLEKCGRMLEWDKCEKQDKIDFNSCWDKFE